MNVAIVGSRTFSDSALIARSIYRWVERAAASGEDLTIVSGGARGADIIGETIAKSEGIPTIIHLPQWAKYGKSAGFRRNDLIVRDADVVLAFFAPGPRSRGTANTVASAKLAGKAVYEYHEGQWFAHEPLPLEYPWQTCAQCGKQCSWTTNEHARTADALICAACNKQNAKSEEDRTDARGVLDPC